MIRKYQFFIERTATLQNTLLLGLLFLIMAFFIMPEAIRQIELSAPKTGIIDGLSFYFPDQMYQKIDAYGENGRKLYMAVELSADLFFSLVIALFLCSLLVYSTNISQTHVLKFKYLTLLPLFIILANCLENGGIILMLLNHPGKYFYLSLATSIAAFSKLVLIISCLLIFGWNLLVYCRSKFHFSKNTNPENPITDSH